MNSYYAYGLNIQSVFPLPELPAARGEPDVFIHWGKFHAQWETPTQVERSFQITPEGALLTWNQYARFLVCDGKEIQIEIANGSSDESVIRHLILGPVFAVLNHQRGRAVFHASAVALEQGGVAFMAGKGYGKSTQAAGFVQRGAPLITDDLLILNIDNGQVWASPGVPFLKLWPASIAMLGEEPGTLPRVKNNIEKRTLTTNISFVQEPVVMQAVFLMEKGDEVKITPVPKKEALMRLIPNWYGSLYKGDLTTVLGMKRQFTDCTALAQNLPFFELKRPASMDLIPEICRTIECLL